MHLNALAAGEFDGVVAAAGIQQHYLIGPTYRRQTIEQIRRVLAIITTESRRH